ncbi:hypothetical protein [Latilactobacillus sakei]|uniref:hypothetical protein n=1 Tax=Latilactobacillus sakei TaxID=1599 RepID=UPI00207435B6|nr:hypothetical protein [Latilactobacillus sakei]USG06537.1 hypothetical protein A4W88_07920 [Latilactobacillus sakei]
MEEKEFSKPQVKEKSLHFFLNNYLFLSGFLIWCIVNILHNTLWHVSIIESNLNILKWICLAILVVKECINIRIDYSMISVLLVSISAVIITYTTKDISILITAAFIIESRNVNFKDILKVYTLVTVVILIVTMYASKHGILETQYFLKSNGTPRYGLGFIYTTYSSQWLFFISAAWISIRTKKITLLELLIILGANIYLYTQTITINPLLCSLILIFLVIILKLDDKFIENKFIKFLGDNTFIIWAIVIILLTALYNRFGILKVVDKLVSNRLRLGNSGLTEYGISFFGQDIVLSGSTFGLLEVLQTKYNYIDSAYVQIIVKYGLILLLYITLGFRNVQKKLRVEKNYYLYIVLVVVSLQAILDPQLIILYYNPFILLLGSLLIKQEVNTNDMLRIN